METLAGTEEACRVYVGNLLPKAKEIHLTNKFARFGTIHSVWIARRPPGFAFVRFATPNEAKRAVEASGDGSMEILGKSVRVQMAGSKEQQVESRDKGRVEGKEAREQRTKDNGGKTENLREHCNKRFRHRSRSRSVDWHRRSRNSCRGNDDRHSRFANRSRSRSEMRNSRSSSRSRRDRSSSRSREYEMTSTRRKRLRSSNRRRSRCSDYTSCPESASLRAEAYGSLH